MSTEEETRPPDLTAPVPLRHDQMRTRARLRATYRVQMTPTFDFSAAAEVSAYLSELGISHLYCAPYLQAAPGSLHGYDVVNYHQVNRSLGGEAGLAQLDEALRARGMGQILDMVPNHMAITGRENPWWWDLLENGPASSYASYFDIEWDAPETRHADAVLVPVLGDHYGRVIEAGEIRLNFDGQDFTVRYYDHSFPVDPGSVSPVLADAEQRLERAGQGSDRLSFLAGAFGRLPAASLSDRASARRRAQDKEVLYHLLSDLYRQQPAVRQAVDEAVANLNHDPDALDIFLGLQNYRLAFWRITRQELGYRRFFDINSLIGLRMGDEMVFLDTHALMLDWLAQGLLDGLRIDHPDGLRDPQGYFQRLRASQRAASDEGEAWIVIEKILELGEDLPAHWPVHGTTGYDFLNRVNGLFVDRSAEQDLSAFYERFTGCSSEYAPLVREKKLLAANEVLGSDIARLQALLLEVCEHNRRYRDYTRPELRAALAELAAAMPVYRTYVRPVEGLVTPHDERYVRQAIETAKANRPDLDEALFDFLGDLLLLRVPPNRSSLTDELVERFQQFTGPVMAKGVEDTVFYIYNRFVSLNEVGGDPGHFGVSPQDFHQACADTLARWPYTMLSTSTHDTKRSEDVRARLNVLSEMPAEWASAVRRWSEITTPYRSEEDLPDRNTEYLFYQTLVGAWPLPVERALAYMEKAAREAKVHSSWRDPNPTYEKALSAFIRAAYGDKHFTDDLHAFVQQIVEAGRTNSLAQTLLKLTTPGIPDIYQGSELWNLTLVDPDNRQPVDYELRRRLLADLRDDADPAEIHPADGHPADILARADEGLPKLWVVRQALALRRRRPEAFGPQSSYTPLSVRGDWGLAFWRGEAGQPQVLVVVPRLSLRGRPHWPTTRIDLPAGPWRNLLTGETIPGGPTSLADLLARFPVGLFESNKSS